MQESNELPWGAQDRFQAHFIVRKSQGGTDDFVARTILKTKGHFGAKKVEKVSWNGGRLAESLNKDLALNLLIANQSVHDASIFVEPTDTGIRIRNQWKNHIEFANLSKDLFDIYDKIAGHIKSL